MNRKLRVRYIGWQGHGNVGDDLLFEVWRDRLHGIDLVVDGVNLDRAGLEIDAVLVGGGTLLLQPDWISVFEQVRRAVPDVPWFGVGLGAQDPTFCPPTNLDSMLGRWRDVVPMFERLSLRGPLSSAYLHAAGMTVPVAGDPGLMTLPDTQVIPKRPRVAINLAGGVAVGRFGEPGSVVGAVGDYIKALRADGFDITLMPLYHADVAPLRGLADLVDLDGVALAEPTISAVKHTIATSNVVICERLHAGCLAAVTGVPFIQMAYQPKCFDFASSINWPHVLASSACDAATLAERTTELVDTWIESAVSLTVAVVRARRIVETELALVEDAIRKLAS
jgi:polysaccharide pyruvyl transferase WcaK-like protein